MADLLEIKSEPPGEDAIQALEEALEEARRGDFSSVAIAIVTREGASRSIWSDMPNRITMLGSIDRLRHKIQQEIDEG